jgi:hypothetical protein
VRFIIPLEHKIDRVGLIASAEVLAELATTGWGARKGFSESRVIGGLSVPLAPGLRLEESYMNQLLNRPRGDFAMNHVIITAIQMRF